MTAPSQPSARGEPNGLPPVVHDSLNSNLEPVSDADIADVKRDIGVRGNRPLVFAILFGVTGAIGLPLLWTSPVFTRREKWLWSIVNILYTLGLIAIAIASLLVIVRALAEAAGG